MYRRWTVYAHVDLCSASPQGNRATGTMTRYPLRHIILILSKPVHALVMPSARIFSNKYVLSVMGLTESGSQHSYRYVDLYVIGVIFLIVIIPMISALQRQRLRNKFNQSLLKVNQLAQNDCMYHN